MNDARSLHVACPHCGATNRIPAARLGDDPVCGRCGQALLDGHPVELSDANFDQVVGRSDLPVVVDFWAPWCGPCRSVAPEVERFASATAGRLLVVKLNTEEFPRIAQTFRIASIPTFVVIRNGQEMNRRSGALPAAALQQLAFSARV